MHRPRKGGQTPKAAREEGKTIREAAIEKGLFPEEEIEAIFQARELTRPGIAGSKKVKKNKEGQT